MHVTFKVSVFHGLNIIVKVKSDKKKIDMGNGKKNVPSLFSVVHKKSLSL